MTPHNNTTPGLSRIRGDQATAQNRNQTNHNVSSQASPKGHGRNVVLTKLAGRLRGQGLEPHEIEAQLLNAPERHGLPASEVRAIARSIGSKPAPPLRPTRAELDTTPPLERLACIRGWTVEALRALGCREGVGKFDDPIIHFPMRDTTGREISTRKRKADNSTFGKTGPKALSEKGKPTGVIVSWPLAAQGALLIVEGEADAAAALSAGAGAVLATPGSQPKPTVWAMAQTLAAGRDVILAPDADNAGEKWKHDAIGALKSVARSILFIPPLPTAGKDLDDRLKRAGGGVCHSEKAKAELARMMNSALEIDTSNADQNTVDETPREWPPIVEVLSALDASPPPSFPIESLDVAPWLRDIVEHSARAFDVPLDLPAVFALGTLAVATQRIADTRPREGWVQPLCLFLCAALNPGERKSDIARLFMRPLRDFERQENERLGPEIARSTEVLAGLETELRSARTAKASGKDSKRNPSDLAVEIERFKADMPRKLSLFADDVTPQAIASELENQGGNYALISAEGNTVFANAAGRYDSKGGSNFENLLKGHAGDSIRVARRAAETIIVDDPRLSVVLACQPDVLLAALGRDDFRGQGFLARFVYAIPAPRVGSGFRKARLEKIPTAVELEFEMAMTRLLSISPGENRRVVEWSVEADMLLEQCQDAIEMRLGSSGDLFHIAEWGAKWPGLVMRLGALLHVAGHLGESDPYNGKVTIAEARAARQIGEWALEQTIRAFDMAGVDSSAKADRGLWAWIVGQHAPVILKQDCWQSVKRRFKNDGEAFNGSLARLERLGAIRVPRTFLPQGGRPREEIHVHPKALLKS